MVARAIRGGKDNLGPQCNALRRVFRLYPGFQRVSLFVGQSTGAAVFLMLPVYISIPA